MNMRSKMGWLFKPVVPVVPSICTLFFSNRNEQQETKC